MLHSPVSSALPTAPLRTAVVIATKGRPTVAAATLASIRRVDEDRPIIVVGTCHEDLAQIRSDPHLNCVIGPTGLTRQRNVGVHLAMQTQAELIYFFDDDIELHHGYFNEVEALMARRPDIVAGSGKVVVNGDVSRDEAIARLRVPRPRSDYPDGFRSRGKHWILHGCNMFIRAEAFESVEFDERLPLYSWGEDYAISIALRRLGLVGRLDRALCVHLLDSGGRINWRQLAFAMSTNIFYFHRSGCVHLPGPLAHVRLLFLLGIRIPVIEVWRHRLNPRTAWQWWRGWLEALGEMLQGNSQPENLARRCSPVGMVTSSR